MYKDFTDKECNSLIEKLGNVIHELNKNHQLSKP